MRWQLQQITALEDIMVQEKKFIRAQRPLVYGNYGEGNFVKLRTS